VSLKFINFNFHVFPLFVPVCLLASCLTLLGLSTLLWYGSCNHCVLAYFDLKLRTFFIKTQFMLLLFIQMLTVFSSDFDFS
jgi:hypothetical protein